MDAGTAAVVGALVGRVLTVVGGLLATAWLGRSEDQREHRRERSRHMTAVRVVVFELRHNVGALIMRAAGGSGLISSTGISSLAADFYVSLPDDLAADVAWSYTLMAGLASNDPAQNKVWIKHMMDIYQALLSYAEKDLGLTISMTGESSKRITDYKEADQAKEPQPARGKAPSS